jgi:hypothetical protein
MGERLEVLMERYESDPVEPSRHRHPPAPAPTPVTEQLATLRERLETVTHELERRVVAAEGRAAVAEAKADAAMARADDVLRATEWLSLAVTGSPDLEALIPKDRGVRKGRRTA